MGILSNPIKNSKIQQIWEIELWGLQKREKNDGAHQLVSRSSVPGYLEQNTDVTIEPEFLETSNVTGPKVIRSCDFDLENDHEH